MAFQDTTSASTVLSREITATRKIFDAIDRFFTSLGESIQKAAVARARFETMRELQGKSDAELARLNLKREDITRHVFNDLYYS